MMPDGVTTSYLDPSTTVAELLGNSEGGTVRIAIELVAAIIAQSIPGPNLTTQAELFADLDWDEPTLGAVWGDANTALNGVYKKSGAAGAGAWTRIGDLPMSAATLAALAAKAPLASPALTGVPSAPTAAPGTNSTQVATTAFIHAALEALVETAPGTLDTLNELAAALNDDPDFATTMANSLALKAPLDTPSFLGVPKSPTAAPGTDTNQIASTAFVQAGISVLSDVVGGKAPLNSPVLTGTPTAPTPGPDASPGEVATVQSVTDAEARAAAQVVSNRRWAAALVAGARTPFAIDWLARMFFRGVDVTDMLTQSALDRMDRLAITSDRSVYELALRDPTGRVGFAITKNVRMIFRGADVTEALDGTLAGRVSSIERKWASLLSIVCWGDSLTQGAGTSAPAFTFPAQLAAMLGRDVENLGIGGQSATQIAARAGEKASLLTVSGDEIPASGTVTVTSLTINLMYFAGDDWQLAGSLAGVAGTLNEDGSGGYTFTRDAAGDAVRCLPDTPFLPAYDYGERLNVIWMGRNDYSHVTDADALAAINVRIKESIAEIVDGMEGVEKRFVILGVTSRDDPIEYVGTNNYNAKRDLAQDLASAYPRNFIDIDAILRANGDGGATDNADIANGVLPTSLTAPDRIHLIDNGYGIVAAEVAARITHNDENDW